MTDPPLAVRRLSGIQRSEVLRLVDDAEHADGRRPLSEQFLLAVRGATGHEVTHLLAYAASSLAGYAQLSEGAAELVVAPSHRRHGVGSSLLASVPPDHLVWAHGDLAAAQAFAAAHQLEVARELWVLGRRLDEPPPLPEVVLPEGLVARSFEVGRDEEEWVRVNAAAFRHHREQGRLTRTDLEVRMAQVWFDPAGLLLVVPAEDEDTVAAFHWTKVHPPSEVGRAPGSDGAKPVRTGRAPGSDGAKPVRTGEVYVVGVDPAYQGKGLGRPLTLLGLHHLRERGVDDVILHVDGDNPAALRIYYSLGFTPRAVDRMYSRAVHTISPEGGTMRS